MPTHSEILAQADNLMNRVGVANFITERRRITAYGTCLRCEVDIPPARLVVFPDADFCVGCKEVSDKIDPPRLQVTASRGGYVVSSRFGGDDRTPRGSGRPMLRAAER